jgi:hypothetical protein
MHESRRKESVEGTEEGIKERHSEATSKETLGDLAESEKLSDSKQAPSPERAAVPSPDGQEDGGRGRSDDASEFP